MTKVFENISSLTPELLAEAEAMVGQELRIEQYNHEATYDSIRHYAFGIGDDNPLWIDEEYASAGPYGTMVAPPTFFYSCFAPGIAPAFPGMQSFQAGGDCRWERLPRRGERVVAKATLTKIDRVEGKTVKDLIIEHGETEYRTGAGELLATFKSRSFRTPRPGADGALQYEPIPQHVYTQEELDAIEHQILTQTRRGGVDRFWEDVEVGDEVPGVVKGPLDRLTMTCYYAGALATAGYKAGEIRWRMRRKALDFPDTMPNNYDVTYFQEMGIASAGHQDDNVAQALGMPAAYDNGHQRMGWIANAVTDWMGDTGFLEHMYTEIRRPNVFGNTVWVTGEITGKRIDSETGSALVEMKLKAVDQRGVENARSTAEVRLPSRAAR